MFFNAIYRTNGTLTEQRVGFQRSAPQNNFRRLIAASIAPGNFCFDTVSYIPASQTKLPLPFLLALLNSKFLDWYFRLGSTNSKVNEYQFDILPCPSIDQTSSDSALSAKVITQLRSRSFDKARNLLMPSLGQSPFPVVIVDALVAASNAISNIELERGEIARNERSALAASAQPYQDFIDWAIYEMAGLSVEEVAGLETRLVTML